MMPIEVSSKKRRLKTVFIDEKQNVYLDGELFDAVTAYRIENSASSREPAKLTLTMYVDVDGVGSKSKELQTEKLGSRHLKDGGDNGK